MVTTEPPPPEYLDEAVPNRPSRAGRREQREVPAAFDAEQAVLGAIMAASGVYDRLAGTLESGDFLDTRHQLIFEAAQALAMRGESIDQVTVGNELTGRGELLTAGGHPYLLELITELPSTVGAEHYAGLVVQKKTYRDMIDAAGEIGRIGYRADPDVGDSLAKAMECLYDIRGANERRDFRLLRDMLPGVLQFDEDAPGADEPTRTGFSDLDQLLNGGLHHSDLVVLAARPGVGKSALALTIARNAAISQPRAVAIFSIEMASDQIAQRLVTSESGVPIERLRSDRHNEHDGAKISSAIGMLSQAEIYVDDSAGLTLAELRARSRHLHARLQDKSRESDGRGALGLIIVDHIQLVHAFSRSGSDVNRVNEISLISRTLKEIARELQVPVLALSQLSREIEKRPDKRPRLSDLRESGSIEQDADVVIFIHPVDRYDRYGGLDDSDYIEDDADAGSEPEAMKLCVEKHRHGQTGAVSVRWVPQAVRFEDFYLYAEPDEVMC